ncbi:MAG TPA: DUF3298 domain-containing protein [Oleiagrimonas sp.]|nr:DUF3298 domain-containing protein [Oleiagrimonas sp.]
MMRVTQLTLATAVAAALILAGCSQPSTPDTAASSTAAPAASAPVTATNTPSATSLPGDHAQTKRYKIAISYPQLPASEKALAETLHRTGDKAKHEFLDALPDPDKYPELAGRQYQLLLEFSVAARMPAFVSIREQGMADTGGAHPIPVDATFVYDTKAGKVIALADLFADPQAARERLSHVARKALEKKLLAKVPGGEHTSAKARKEWVANMREMITEGTQPTAENFSEFVVLAGAGDQASGLELVFPPYQVAPYVYGTQTVDVPVDLFGSLLKPSYGTAFDLAK